MLLKLGPTRTPGWVQPVFSVPHRCSKRLQEIQDRAPALVKLLVLRQTQGSTIPVTKRSMHSPLCRAKDIILFGWVRIQQVKKGEGGCYW